MTTYGAADAWAGRLGITPVRTEEGDWRFQMPLGPDHLNFLDGAHGGALFSLAESAVRQVASGDGERPKLIDAHLVLTAGGEEGDAFVARVEPISVGRTLGVYRAVVTRGDGRMVGTLTGTVRFGQ